MSECGDSLSIGHSKFKGGEFLRRRLELPPASRGLRTDGGSIVLPADGRGFAQMFLREGLGESLEGVEKVDSSMHLLKMQYPVVQSFILNLLSRCLRLKR